MGPVCESSSSSSSCLFVCLFVCLVGPLRGGTLFESVCQHDRVVIKDRCVNHHHHHQHVCSFVRLVVCLFVCLVDRVVIKDRCVNHHHHHHVCSFVSLFFLFVWSNHSGAVHYSRVCVNMTELLL